MNKSINRIVAAMIAIVAATFSAQTHATLIGDTVNIAVGGQFGSSASPASAVVGTGPEFSVDYSDGRAIIVDIGASSIDFTYNGSPRNAAFLSFANMFIRLSGLDFAVPGITGVNVSEIPSSGGAFPFGGNFVAFTGDSVTLNLRGTWDFTDSVHVDLLPRQVPEPATLALAALGLAGFGFSQRKATQA